jgi:predicted transcriptional regulator
MRPFRDEEKVGFPAPGGEQTEEPGAKGMRLAAIRDLLQCTVLAGGEALDIEVDTAVAADGMSAVLAALHPGALLITGLANIQSVRTADVAFISAILYVRGSRPNETAIEFARKKKIVLLSTALGMFDTCGTLRNQGLKGAA